MNYTVEMYIWNQTETITVYHPTLGVALAGCGIWRAVYNMGNAKWEIEWNRIFQGKYLTDCIK